MRLPMAIVAALAVVAPVAAQTAQVRGRIVDVGDGAPIGGATVTLTPLSGGAAARRTTTADDGFFLVVDIAAGRYVLRASHPGYTPVTDTLELADGQRRIRGLALRALTLDEVVVERAPVAIPGASRVDAADLTAFPTIVPGGDAGVTLAALPGVVAFEDGGGLFIRGGEATHVLYRVEGVPVYQPVHGLGPLLAVPADAIAYVDLTPGALPEQLGGRAGAAVEVGLRGGDRERLVARGRVGVGLGATLAALHAEVPVLPGRASLTLSGRGQLFGRARVPASAAVDGAASGLRSGERRFDARDGLVRFHAFATPLVTVSALALASHDAVEALLSGSRPVRLTTDNRAAGATFAYLPEQFPLRTELRAFVSRLRTASERPSPVVATGVDTRTSEADAYGGEIALAYLLGPQRVTFGLFATSQRLASVGIAVDEAPPGSGQPRTEEFVTEGGAWLGVRLDGGRLGVVEPGVRVHGFPSRARVSVEPRLRYSVPVGGAARVFAAGGVQAQEVGGFLLSPGAADAFVAVVPTPAHRPPVRAVHAEAGATTRLGRFATLDAAAWHRATSHLGLDGRTTARGAGADVRLDVRGVEVAGRGLALRLAYGLARVEYRDAIGRTAAPPFDRLHTGDVAARLDLVPGLRLDAHVRAGTGTPFTRTGGYGDVPVDPDDPFGPTRPLVFGTDVARLPSSVRADVALAYARQIGALGVEASAGVRNVTGQRTIASIEPVTLTRLDAPGRTLTVGLSVAWR